MLHLPCRHTCGSHIGLRLIGFVPPTETARFLATRHRQHEGAPAASDCDGKSEQDEPPSEAMLEPVADPSLGQQVDELRQEASASMPDKKVGWIMRVS